MFKVVKFEDSMLEFILNNNVWEINRSVNQFIVMSKFKTWAKLDHTIIDHFYVRLRNSQSKIDFQISYQWIDIFWFLNIFRQLKSMRLNLNLIITRYNIRMRRNINPRMNFKPFLKRFHNLFLPHFFIHHNKAFIC